MMRALAVAVLVVLIGCASKSQDDRIEPGPGPSAGPATSTPTMADLWAEPTSNEGMKVTLTGVVAPGALSRSGTSFTVGGPVCTELACGDEAPCCNSCRSPAMLRAGDKELLGVELAGDGIGCTGDECQLTCKPAAGETVTIEGVVRSRRDGQGTTVRLEVTSIEPAAQ